jgi:hypothetical protein
VSSRWAEWALPASTMLSGLTNPNQPWWAVSAALFCYLAIICVTACWLVTRPNSGAVEVGPIKWKAFGEKSEPEKPQPPKQGRRWFHRLSRPEKSQPETKKPEPSGKPSRWFHRWLHQAVLTVLLVSLLLP